MASKLKALQTAIWNSQQIGITEKNVSDGKNWCEIGCIAKLQWVQNSIQIDIVRMCVTCNNRIKNRGTEYMTKVWICFAIRMQHRATPFIISNMILWNGNRSGNSMKVPPRMIIMPYCLIKIWVTRNGLSSYDSILYYAMCTVLNKKSWFNLNDTTRKYVTFW